MERKTEINLFSVKKFLKTKGSFLLYRSRNDGNKRNNSTPIMSRGKKKSGIAPRELFPVLRYPRGAINKPSRRLKERCERGPNSKPKRNPIKNLLKAYVSFFGDSSIKDPGERTIRKK